MSKFATLITMSDSMPITPFDILDITIGNEVTVMVKTGEAVHGTLAGYDQHLNITLTGVDDCPMATATDDQTTGSRDELLVIRGQMVVSIAQPSIDVSVASETTANSDTTDVSQSIDSDKNGVNNTFTADLTTLQDRLTQYGLDVQFDDESEELVVEKLGVTYYIRPGHVDGDGPHREQIEQLIID
ncbi:LSM domain-containing protein [Halocatena marina]